MKLSTTQRAITRGKLKARAWMPYLSHVFSIMRTHTTDTVPTMCVDGDARLYINEEFVASLTPEETGYCLLHEVLHIVLSHGKRFRAACLTPTEKERLCWNVAADLCIQQMLARHLQCAEPKGIVTIDGEFLDTGKRFLSIPGLSRGMSTEQYYGLLLPLMPPQSGKGKGGQGQDEHGPLDPRDAGSNSDGEPKPGEKQSSLVERAMLDEALQEAEREMEEAESKAPGSVPGNLRKTLSTRLRKQPDPFDQLRNVVARSVASPIGQEEYTYRRLSRRQIPDMARKRGIVRWSPECSIIVDTSGSMCGREEKALTAVAQGLRRVQQPRVCLFDTVLHDDKRMSTIKNFQWKGYGGTDMTAAIQHADTKHRADAIVLITDGETSWPSEPTRAKLIIALVANPGSCQPPAWSTVVHCYREVNTYAH